jgi:phospholipid/cholesterol/gamma-HCH transport system substrate-binding protein
MSNIESISNTFKNNNENFTRIVKNFTSISDTVVKLNFSKTINNANKAIVQTNEVIEKINKKQGTLGMLVNNDSLYKNLEAASVNLNKLMEDIRLNPQRYLHYSLFDLNSDKIKADKKKKK